VLCADWFLALSLFLLTVPAEQVPIASTPLARAGKTDAYSYLCSLKTQAWRHRATEVVSMHSEQPQWVGDYGQAVPAPSLSQRVLGMLVIALPLATGGSQLCACIRMRPAAEGSIQSSSAAMYGGAWSLGVGAYYFLGYCGVVGLLLFALLLAGCCG